MGKVNLLVKCCLINSKSEYNIKGIFNDNKIKFLLEDKIMLIDLSCNTLKRSDLEKELFFEFNKKICTVYDKTNNNKMVLEIELIKSEIRKDYFFVKYKIIDNEFEIMIKII